MACITSYSKNMVDEVLSEAILKFHCRTLARKRQYLVSPFLGYEKLRTI